MDKVEKAINDIRQGKFVIVVDDEKRENEGDLIIAAEKVTPADIAFMVRHTTGIICVSLPGERLDHLHIPLMVATNTDKHLTPFTISVDYRYGTTTGVSANDRTASIQALINPETRSTDFRRPGHIFPLRYTPGGVLKRPGHTEAALDLVQIAGLASGGVLCEIVNEDGSMARMPDLIKFAQKHNIGLISIADLIRYRRQTEKLVKMVSEARLPTAYGDFNARVYESTIDERQHLVLIKGDISSEETVLVRVHSECLTGDVFRSRRCDCGEQLDLAMQQIANAGTGIIVYLRGHEGRGIGLGHKLNAYYLQDKGQDTVDANISLGFPADSREYSTGAQILADLNVKKIRLLTNNPSKYSGLSGYDLDIVERVPLISEPHCDNYEYMVTKQTKLGHILNIR